MELVDRFRQGDLGAYEKLFEIHSPSLLAFLTRMCGNREDAKESLQDTFLAVYRYLKDFRGEASLKNWIFKIAVNNCLKKKRKAPPAQESIEIDGTVSGQGIDPAAFTEARSRSPSRWGLDPEEHFLEDELRRHMVQGVARMPYIYKVVINLRDFEGFSTEEVAQMLGIKPSTVKVRLHRARLQLRDWLRERRGGETPEKEGGR